MHPSSIFKACNVDTYDQDVLALAMTLGCRSVDLFSDLLVNLYSLSQQLLQTTALELPPAAGFCGFRRKQGPM
jgi:hypothetical protein